jgi:hypothetical protein
MSINENILKNLLLKLLQSRLERLETRNQEQMKDLKKAKMEYKKQGEYLKKIKIKKPKKKLTRNKTYDNLLNNKSIITKKNNIRNYNNNNKYERKAVTPLRAKKIPKDITNTDNKNKNNKRISNYNNYKKNKNEYIGRRYKEDLYSKQNINNKKKYLTPEPIKKRKKIFKNIDKNNNGKNENRKTTKLNNVKIETNNKENEEKEDTRNINTIKREEDNKKRTIISDLGLEEGEIQFVFEQIGKKGKNKKESDNESDSESSKSYSSNSSNSEKPKQNYKLKNEEIIKRFIIYTNSSDGNEIIKIICSFLDKESNIYFLSCTKKYIKYLVQYLNGLYNNIEKFNKVNINQIGEQIKDLKKKYKEDELDSAKYAFNLSEGSIKALEQLNNDLYNYIFKKEKLEPPLDEIIIIYRIFFQLIDKEELCDIENDKIFWEKTRTFILKKNKGKTGTFLKDYVSEFDFTNRNIYKLKKLIYGNEDKLKPLYYENINKTTGLIIFIIKDSFEYCGIFRNNKKTMPSMVLHYLEYLLDNLNILKKYIDELKKFINQ